MKRASIYLDAEQEALRYKWIESEKAGRDLGEEALRRWVRLHWWGYLRARWVEHLKGTRYWIELDRGDFGLLRREFRDQAVLLDRILDRVLAGHQNLDIVRWAADWGIPMGPSVEILEALDFNGRRLETQFDHPRAPFVTLDPAWLSWNGGTVPGLARAIAEGPAYDLLPMLGDALEEAGCNDPSILRHCRTGGADTSKSWLVDLIVARTQA